MRLAKIAGALFVLAFIGTAIDAEEVVHGLQGNAATAHELKPGY